MRYPLRALYLAIAITNQYFCFDITAHAANYEKDIPDKEQYIVVTGEKRSRTTHDTVASVAVETSKNIEREGLISLDDILDRTPNLTVDGSRTTFSIRGVDAFNVSGAGDGPLASVYLDGAAIPRLALASGPLDLYDVAQVEIFRGPQSSIQGRNALAGAVFIRTVDPDFAWSARARFLMTDKDHQRRASAVLGGPLIGDDVAFRISGEISGADGLIRDITTNSNADERSSRTLRGKLLLTPHGVPALRVVAAVMHDEHKRGTFYTELDPPYSATDRISTADVVDTKRVTSNIATIDLSYDLSHALVLHSISSYSDIRYRSVSDANRTALAGPVSRIDDRTRAFQQELRLNVTTSRIDGVVGAFYLRNRRPYIFSASQNLSLTSLGVDSQLRSIGLPPATVDAVLALYGGAIPISNNLRQYTATENYAGFADMTYALSSRLRLNLGLRYDRETQHLSASQSIATDRAFPDPATLANPALGAIVSRLNTLLGGLVAGANGSNPERSVTYQAWLPKLGIIYDMTPNLAFSFTFQRGYRAGGSGLNQQRGTSYDFGPEYTSNYEIGVRSDWFDKRLTLNANIFATRWRDQQTLLELTPGAVFDTQVTNIGKSRLYGFEIEAQGRPSPLLSLYAGMGYTNTKFLQFVASDILVQNVQGREFPRAPHWTVSGGATVGRSTGLFANLNFNYRSGYYQDADVQGAPSISGRTLVNARLGWQGEHVGAFLIATNLFDVQKPNQFFYDLDGRRRGTLNDPRILGFTVEGRY